MSFVFSVTPEAQCELKTVIKVDKSDIRSTNDPSKMKEDTLFISESTCHSLLKNNGCMRHLSKHNYLIAWPESCREGFGLYSGENGWIDDYKMNKSGA